MKLSSVMVVDDSEADQFLARRIIEKYSKDIKILKAYDGEEALEILGGLLNQPDVIFLDINMPRMNGHEFLAIYDTWENQSPVVVMLTSSEQEQDIKKSRAHRCVSEYFTKPIDFASLEKLVQPKAA